MADLAFHAWGTHPGWELIDDMVRRAYPEFMNHDAVANRCFPLMYEMYPEWQQLATDGDEAIGFLNCAPLPFSGSDDDLPAEGWDWAMDLATRERATATQTACGIQIVIDPDLHGRGYARAMVAQMRAVAARHGCHRLYVPIRPTLKPGFAEESMAAYAARTRPDGQPFDPWQRVHVSSGGTVLKPCDRAMVIEGSIADWLAWTGLEFTESGEHVVPGALAPVVVDLANDLITYVEPNLWVRHDIGPELRA